MPKIIYSSLISTKSQMKSSHASLYVANCINIQAITVKAKTWEGGKLSCLEKRMFTYYKHFAVACL